jgi:hypothetical protein
MTCISAHEQTPLSNHAIDSFLRHGEVCRAKDLPATRRALISIYKRFLETLRYFQLHVSAFNLSLKMASLEPKHVTAMFLYIVHTIHF